MKITVKKRMKTPKHYFQDWLFVFFIIYVKKNTECSTSTIMWSIKDAVVYNLKHTEYLSFGPSRADQRLSRSFSLSHMWCCHQWVCVSCFPSFPPSHSFGLLNFVYCSCVVIRKCESGMDFSIFFKQPIGWKLCVCSIVDLEISDWRLIGFGIFWPQQGSRVQCHVRTYGKLTPVLALSPPPQRRGPSHVPLCKQTPPYCRTGNPGGRERWDCLTATSVPENDIKTLNQAVIQSQWCLHTSPLSPAWVPRTCVTYGQPISLKKMFDCTAKHRRANWIVW